MIDIIKLKALLKKIKDSFNSFDGEIPDEFIEPLIEQFTAINLKLNENYPELISDYTIQNYKSYVGDYDMHSLSLLEMDIKYHIEIFSEMDVPSMKSISITSEGIFFAGQFFDALNKIVNIINEAKKEIIFIDGYINSKILEIFKENKPSVSLKVITKKSSLNATLNATIDAYRKQYGPIEIKVTEKFHDRFLIIDKKQFYHFGASLKDAGNKSFMFSRIEEPIIQSKLIEEIEKIK